MRENPILSLPKDEGDDGGSMITGIDHVAILVRDFDATVKSYETIFGRAPNWLGFMPGGRHAWFQFDGMALDIIGSDGTGPEADASRAEIAKFGDAIWGLGFSVPDLDAATRLFERRGLNFLPRHTTRTTNASGATRSWEVAVIKRKSAHGVALFLVENKPAASPWPVAPTKVADEAAVSTLDHIVVNTTHPERATALYGARLALDLRLDRTNEQWGARQCSFAAASRSSKSVPISIYRQAMRPIRSADWPGGCAIRRARAPALLRQASMCRRYARGASLAHPCSRCAVGPVASRPSCSPATNERPQSGPADFSSGFCLSATFAMSSRRMNSAR